MAKRLSKIIRSKTATKIYKRNTKSKSKKKRRKKKPKKQISVDIKKKFKDLKLKGNELIKKINKSTQNLHEKFYKLKEKKNEKYQKTNSKYLKEKARNEKLKKKIEILKQMEKEKKFKECTFNPEINENTEKILKNLNRLALHERDLVTKFEKDYDYHVSQSPKKLKKKKLDKNFFVNQMNWKNKINKELENKRIFSKPEINKNPDLNFTKKMNKKILKTKPNDFLTRVAYDLENSKKLKKKLDNKYNGFTFIPIVNENNKSESIVKKIYN